MDNRERVIVAIQHKDTEKIPYNVDFTIEEAEKIIRYTKNPKFLETIGNHMDSVSCTAGFDIIKPGFVKDSFDVIWNRTVDRDIGIIDKIKIPVPDKKLICLPEPDSDIVNRNITEMLKRKNNNFKIANIGFSLFERAWTLCGMENLLMWMVTDADFVHTLLDKICDYNLKIIEQAVKYPIDCFMFGDDWGQQKGLITGPGYWRKFILPRIKKMYDAVKKSGKFIAQHSCGDILEIFPDLIDAGLDIYQTFQPEIYDIKKVKKEYGANLTFWGGISTQAFLPFASPLEVKIKTREIMNILGKSGGYIAAPTHAMPKDIPEENVIALIEVFQNQ